MKLEDQVVSLELAKKLKALGCKQESYFKWNEEEGADAKLYTEAEWDEFCEDFIPPDGEMYSAYTVAELGEMLPSEIYNSSDREHPVHRLICEKTTQSMSGVAVMGWHTFYICKTCMGRLGSQWDITEADARAKMRVYLLENKLIS